MAFFYTVIVQVAIIKYRKVLIITLFLTIVIAIKTGIGWGFEPIGTYARTL